MDYNPRQFKRTKTVRVQKYFQRRNYNGKKLLAVAYMSKDEELSVFLNRPPPHNKNSSTLLVIPLRMAMPAPPGPPQGPQPSPWLLLSFTPRPHRSNSQTYAPHSAACLQPLCPGWSLSPSLLSCFRQSVSQHHREPFQSTGLITALLDFRPCRTFSLLQDNIRLFVTIHKALRALVPADVCILVSSSPSQLLIHTRHSFYLMVLLAAPPNWHRGSAHLSLSLPFTPSPNSYLFLFVLLDLIHITSSVGTSSWCGPLSDTHRHKTRLGGSPVFTTTPDKPLV